MDLNAGQSRQIYSGLAGMCTRPFRPRPRRDRDVGNCVRDETETETLQVAETLPRRLVKSSKQSPQVAAYRDNEVVSGLITSHL